jgi:hypothetical protein
VAAAQHQRHRWLAHACYELRNTQARLHIAADGIEQNEQPLYLRRLLNRRKKRHDVFVLCGLCVLRQYLVPLNLADNGETVYACRSCRTQLFYIVALFVFIHATIIAVKSAYYKKPGQIVRASVKQKLL